MEGYLEVLYENAMLKEKGPSVCFYLRQETY